MCVRVRWGGQQHKMGGEGGSRRRAGESRRLRGKATRCAHLERRLNLFSRDELRERWRRGQRLRGQGAEECPACNDGITNCAGHAVGTGPNGWSSAIRLCAPKAALTTRSVFMTPL